MSKFFMNDRKTLINDVIEGVILTSPYKNLAKLDIDPAIRVVVRRDWDKKKVALISGGGSGHEPAHVGFVGKGMLTAAVCGEVFASPSVDAVLNAIVAVTGKAGCLLIVKNYTGDRLNFGLAAEKAKGMGYNVELVMVSDDISLPENKQPRGIAGTALVHKIAGYAAEQGKSLKDVTKIAQQAINATASIGVAAAGCSLPGGGEDEEEQRIESGHVELGLGIHGEPGVSTMKTQNSKKVVDTLVGKLAEHVKKSDKLAVLINNLGGVSPLEMNQITKELVHSALGSSIRYLIGPASLVSALDMKGFSLSVIALKGGIEEALLAEVEASGWQPLVKLEKLAIKKGKKISDKKTVKASSNAQVGKIVETITQTLSDLEDELNKLDAKVGDGDTGSTFATGARDIQKENKGKRLPLNNVADLLGVVGDRLATVMGGSSGVLMSIFFTAAGKKVGEGEKLPKALLSGLERMKHYGGADLGDRTMIDALQPALEALGKKDALKGAAKAAAKGAKDTASMKKANAGRSSYLSSNSLKGVKDPGAVAVEKVFEALAKK
ncbi:DAK2 domain-containing protein [Rahnella aquatilis]|jgi:dihydroxyacetone kinase|uniref:Dihydroxyacetone kinase subunit DhaK n=1 Tax=Rahnella sp. (strain Y9602) TaxID=2703885 RepID=A0ABW6C2Z3_RAHSY|nr:MULTISPECIES: dihydroxyacetone kinase subunit DhaK [Rahnella]AZP43880.1 DAK2 domain-containing protein [Rahnella aquatilis]AZP48217.1 DAK2 domain-containing protein [Rahnella aquatilis]MBU9865467.1 dihydroxyacetone kinase subunit DhaK [Rahnella aceris]MCM2446151.1 DAK2 domain-containing protein [Rahnella sp. CG8]MDP9703083.1 dihydroxyacetone kinase [Rahnella aquatilis]